MRRIVTLAGNVLASNITDLRRPYKLTYIVTNRCQFQCRMCNIWKKDGGGEMSLDHVKRFFSRSNHFSWINLSGGEVFLRDDFLDIVGFIHDTCKSLYLLNFPTNGYRTGHIVGSVAKILRRYRFPRLMVTVSLDGTPELHERIRNMPGSWERAIDTFGRLRALRSGRFSVFLGMTLQDANFNMYDPTFESVRRRIGDISHADFHVNIVHRSGHYFGNPDLNIGETQRPFDRELARIMRLRPKSYCNPVSFLERRYQNLSGRYMDSRKTPVPCQALSASLFMDPAGMVYPCSIFNRAVGNIRDFNYDLSALWNDAKRHDLRKAIRKGECPQCWTPCEAYQSILGALMPILSDSGEKRHD